MADTADASQSDQKTPLELSAVEIQQEYYEVMGDADWELYEKKDRHLLLQKIAVALFGPPTKEGNLADNEPTLKLQGYEHRNEEIVQSVFNQICKQAKYSHNGENICISILRVVCVMPAKDIPFYKKEPVDYWVDLHLKRGNDVIISVFHVFRVRKCIALHPGEKSCATFIDHDARVYKDWKSYLEENRLPKGVMIVPESGKYNGVFQNTTSTSTDIEMPKVQLTVLPSPALGIGAKILNIADTTNTVAGVGALVGAIGVMAAPVAAPVAVGTVLAVGAVTSIYGIVRSSIHLADRGKHEQSISLKNSESRASWINILVSTAGLSFTAAGRLLSWAATTGTNVRILINAVQFLKYTTVASGLVGLANGLGEMIHKYKKYQELPTKLELFQFTSSVLFFGIGVMSNQTAQEIVEDAQAKSINNFRDSLTSNAKRKMFDKVTAETRRLQGTVQGNTDIIKGLKTITNKNDFFAKLSKMNKQFNQNKLRVSLSSEGVPLINNQVKMTVSQLYELGKECRNQLFTKIGPAEITTKNVPTRIYPMYASTSQIASTESRVASYIYIRPEELIKIVSFLNMLSKADKKSICELLSLLSSDLHQAFLLLCAKLIHVLIPSETASSILGWDWKMRVVLFVYDFLSSKFVDTNEDERQSSISKKMLEEFILNGKIKPKSFEMLYEKITIWLSELKNKSNTTTNFDSRKHDPIHIFRNKYQRRYVNLQPGQAIKVGNVTIIIKRMTVETLEEWLVEPNYSQDECDMLLEFCIKVLSAMSEEEINFLNLINPDEDIILRIVKFIISWNLTPKLLKEYEENGTDNIDIAKQIKRSVMDWGRIEKVREHEICELCKGIRYCEK